MKTLRIALAGNANVGKSVLFNHLTGLQQHIGNWPGKTIEKAEGRLNFKGVEINVIDLPGIYSFSTFSSEELISRDYIAKERPDVIVNVIDASVLERSLFFTLQLLELGRPVVIALNMMDVACAKGIEVNEKKLSKMLGVPIVPITATEGKGISELMETVLKAQGQRQRPFLLAYRKKLEAEIRRLTRQIERQGFAYPPRWMAVKLLEEDAQVVGVIGKRNPEIIENARKTRLMVEKSCGQSSSVALSSERYYAAERIARACMALKKTEIPISQKLDSFLLHRFFGYFFLALVAAIVFLLIFCFGDFFSIHLLGLLSSLKVALSSYIGDGFLQEIIVSGVVEGLIAGISIALPYLVPFYIILAILEDSGYLARMAFLMDAFMHMLGMHGKAFIPMILAYGCNVPACLSCRILETRKDRLLASFIVTLIPCAAVTVVIMGLVATYVGLEWALGLYILNLLVILVLGRIAFKAIPGEPVGLVMEMPSYKMPMPGNVLMQAWKEIRSFVFMALPIIVASTFLIKLAELLGWLNPISDLISPVTVGWLGLPSVVGITLIFGVLRKELALITLAALLGTEAFDTVLTPIQMVTFAVVTMFYVPCAATIAALKKEHGWRVALGISAFEVVFAILLAGLIARGLEIFLF